VRAECLQCPGNKGKKKGFTKGKRRKHGKKTSKVPYIGKKREEGEEEKTSSIAKKKENQKKGDIKGVPEKWGMPKVRKRKEREEWRRVCQKKKNPPKNKRRRGEEKDPSKKNGRSWNVRGKKGEGPIQRTKHDVIGPQCGDWLSF